MYSSRHGWDSSWLGFLQNDYGWDFQQNCILALPSSPSHQEHFVTTEAVQPKKKNPRANSSLQTRSTMGDVCFIRLSIPFLGLWYFMIDHCIFQGFLTSDMSDSLIYCSSSCRNAHNMSCRPVTVFSSRRQLIYRYHKMHQLSHILKFVPFHYIFVWKFLCKKKINK